MTMPTHWLAPATSRAGCLAALPPELQAEVLEQQRSQRRQAHVVHGLLRCVASMSWSAYTQARMHVYSPGPRRAEYLAALPPELQAEVLEQQRSQRRQARAVSFAVPCFVSAREETMVTTCWSPGCAAARAPGVSRHAALAALSQHTMSTRRPSVKLRRWVQLLVLLLVGHLAARWASGQVAALLLLSCACRAYQACLS